MSIDCYDQFGFLRSAEGPLDVDGIELRLYCYNTEVVSTCDIQGGSAAREIGGFTQTIHLSGQEFELGHFDDSAYYNSGLDSFGVNEQSFDCQINLPTALVVAAIL